MFSVGKGGFFLVIAMMDRKENRKEIHKQSRCFQSNPTGASYSWLVEVLWTPWIPIVTVTPLPQTPLPTLGKSYRSSDRFIHFLSRPDPWWTLQQPKLYPSINDRYSSMNILSSSILSSNAQILLCIPSLGIWAVWQGPRPCNVWGLETPRTARSLTFARNDFVNLGLEPVVCY